MYLAVVSLHVVLSLMLILIILVQPGRGGDVGAAFGGGDSSLFGPRGPASALSRITSGAAILFMVTSITLAWFSNKEVMANSNVLDEIERVNQERLDKKSGDATDAAAPAAEQAPGAGGEAVPVPLEPMEAEPPADEGAPAGE